jgi:hypothetical protein
MKEDLASDGMASADIIDFGMLEVRLQNCTGVTEEQVEKLGLEILDVQWDGHE